MGRSLRSGRQIASLSPPNKRFGGKDVAKGKTPPSAAAPPMPRTNAARGKGSNSTRDSQNRNAVKSTSITAKRASKLQTKNESSESEEADEAMVERKSKADRTNEEEESDSSESRSSDEEEEVVKRTVASSAKPAPTMSNIASTTANSKKQDSSEEEESEDDDMDDSDDELDERIEKVAVAPLKRSPHSNRKTEEEEEEEESFAADSDDEEEEESDEESSGDSDVKDKGFTDENANWLKPKQSTKMTLMSSDDDEKGDDNDDHEFDAAAESSDDDDDEMLEVERQSRIIDEELELEREEAEQELRRTIAQQTSVFHLPTPEELEDDENRVVPPSELRARIEDVLEVLADFKARRELGRSRSEYIERLGKDMAELFGYLQELVDYFLSMFGPNECLEFLEASDKSRPLVVRVNTLKARRKDLAAALMKRGVRLDPLAPWSKVGLKIYESTVPIGATPEYLAGHYMLQSAASMCPVMALGPQPGDRILDMSAAPGGKTSYISQLMRNKGVIIANDLKPERQKATVANLHRLGVRNAVTCCYDGRKIGSQMRNSFDRILLDAPCSGLGVISRDPSVKVQRTMPEVLRCAHLQKELLVAAIDALNHKSKKGGGYIVYSTCSVAVAENEEVVNYLLSKRDVKLVDTGLDFGKPGFTRFEHKRFHPSVALTRRFYPHVHNMDGFFVAKIQKLSDKRKGEEVQKEQQSEMATDHMIEDDTLNIEASNNRKQQGIKKNQKNNKRGKASNMVGNDIDDDGGEKATRTRKKFKTSHAPNNVQIQRSGQKKKRINAKISKPRRMKITGM